MTTELDPTATPVWYRHLPPPTPLSATTARFMATEPQPPNVHAVEVPSRTPSPTTPLSLPTTQGGDADPQPRRSARMGRSADRPLLRTAFRNFSGVATVVVGEASSKSRPQTQYLVHKELLTAASPFFAAALNGTFAEGLDQVVHLPEEKPDTFEWFLQWLYTGTLTTQPTNPEPVARGCHGERLSPFPQAPTAITTTSTSTGPTATTTSGPLPGRDLDTLLDGDLRNAAGSPKYFLLLDLYALSDRLLTTPLNNHITTTLARLSEATNSVPTPSDTWLLYDAIRPCSPLRALVLDLFAYKKTDRLLDSHRDDWHPRFLRDLVVKLKRPPGPDALLRHALVPWAPAAWAAARACEGCREVCAPGVEAVRCAGCERAFCKACVRRCGAAAAEAGGGGGAGAGAGAGAAAGASGWSCWGGGDGGACKPWIGNGVCWRYHEHRGGESCG